jgi:hypothetical protein
VVRYGNVGRRTGERDKLEPAFLGDLDERAASST